MNAIVRMVSHERILSILCSGCDRTSQIGKRSARINPEQLRSHTTSALQFAFEPPGLKNLPSKSIGVAIGEACYQSRECFSSRQAGLFSGWKKHIRSLDRLPFAGAIDFPSPRHRKGSAMLHHDRIVIHVEIEICVHATIWARWPLNASPRPEQPAIILATSRQRAQRSGVTHFERETSRWPKGPRKQVDSKQLKTHKARAIITPPAATKSLVLG